MKYRKLPIVIEAFCFGIDPIPPWFMDQVTDNKIILYNNPIKNCEIKTLEGEMVGLAGDYIIRGIKGEIYPCKPDIFEMTYEAVEDIAPKAY